MTPNHQQLDPLNTVTYGPVTPLTPKPSNIPDHLTLLTPKMPKPYDPLSLTWSICLCCSCVLGASGSVAGASALCGG